MKKPLRLFAFVFFLFAIYLNLFYKEDSFLARITPGKSSPNKTQTTSTEQPATVNTSDSKLAQVNNK
jgi:hypothetical protein